MRFLQVLVVLLGLLCSGVVGPKYLNAQCGQVLKISETVTVVGGRKCWLKIYRIVYNGIPYDYYTTDFCDGELHSNLVPNEYDIELSNDICNCGRQGNTYLQKVVAFMYANGREYGHTFNESSQRLQGFHANQCDCATWPEEECEAPYDPDSCTQDIDGDGTANCNDDDDDGDGIPDGDDEHPQDPAPYDPGNCSQDWDGDGINNCDDPDDDGDGVPDTGDGDPSSPCDPSNCDLDCDHDGTMNCDDANPNCNLDDCNKDCDGDGTNNCDDDTPNGDPCGPSDCAKDCDNDGIMNCDDDTPTGPGSCNENDCSKDCDGDGILNCQDPDPDNPPPCDACDPASECYNAPSCEEPCDICSPSCRYHNPFDPSCQTGFTPNCGASDKTSDSDNDGCPNFRDRFPDNPRASGGCPACSAEPEECDEEHDRDCDGCANEFDCQPDNADESCGCCRNCNTCSFDFTAFMNQLVAMVQPKFPQVDFNAIATAPHEPWLLNFDLLEARMSVEWKPLEGIEVNGVSMYGGVYEYARLIIRSTFLLLMTCTLIWHFVKDVTR